MMSPYRNEEYGIGLIELMVSAVISLILIAGVVGLTVNSSSAYRSQVNHVRNQENSRFAFDFLSRDIRMAGYLGCLTNDANLTNNLNVADDGNLYDVDETLEGFEQGQSSWLPSGGNTSSLNMIPGTDAITIRFVSPAQSAELDQTANAAGTVDAENNAYQFAEGNVVILSDCEKGDLFQVSNSPSSSNVLEHYVGDALTPGNLKNELGGFAGADYFAADGNAKVFRYYAVRYFVRHRVAGDTSTPVALYRSYVSDQGRVFTEEVVEGIENLQLLYGEDTDSDGVANSYVKATGVSNWSNVLSVQIGILARSNTEVGFASEQRQTAGGAYTTFQVLDETITLESDPTSANFDRYQRNVYSSTVYIRNPL